MEVQKGKVKNPRPIKAMDLVKKVRDALSLETNITTAIYGIEVESKAEKALQSAYSATIDLIG